MTESYARYDYAWQTPAWTVQNGAINTSGTLLLAPDGLKNVVLGGEFFDDHGRPISGRITVTPSVRRVIVDGKTVILHPRSFRVRHGAVVEGTLLSPDGTVTSQPASWSYDIRMRLGPITNNHILTVPVTDNVVNLALLEDETVPTEVSTFPLERDYTFYPGTTFTREFQWTGVTLDGWTAKMQVREAYGSPTDLLTLTEGAGITLGSDGLITITITDTQTGSLAGGVYDLELTDLEGTVTRFLAGRLTPGDPQVTI